jgi:hypothetical protein
MSESEQDQQMLKKLHSIIVNAGKTGIPLDEILDTTGINHKDIEAILNIMGVLLQLRNRGLIIIDTIQTQCGTGTMCEIRYFPTERK